MGQYHPDGSLVNPGQAWRADRLRVLSTALAVLGAADAAYLTWVKLAGTRALCTPGGGCEVVNTSIYSEIRGIPVAALGLVAYLILAVLLALEVRVPWVGEYGPLAIFGLALTGSLYSAYLTYIELFVINAICPYCVISALLITGIFLLSVARLARSFGASPTSAQSPD